MLAAAWHPTTGRESGLGPSPVLLTSRSVPTGARHSREHQPCVCSSAINTDLRNPPPYAPPRAIWSVHVPAPRVYTAAPSRRAFLWMALANELGEVGSAAGYKTLQARTEQGQASSRAWAEDGRYRQDGVRLCLLIPSGAVPARMLASCSLGPVRGAD